MKKYSDQLDLLADQKGYPIFFRKLAENGKEDQEGGDKPQNDTKSVQRGAGNPPKRPQDTRKTNTKEEYYFASEGVFQYVIEICLDVTRFLL